MDSTKNTIIGDLAMPSYQSPTPLGDPTGRWLTFSAAVAA